MSGDQPSPNPSSNLTSRLNVDFALQAAGLGVWELDPSRTKLNWDDRCRELFGIAKDNPLTYEEAIQYIHPDDRDRVDQAVQRVMAPTSDGQYDMTYRTIGADDGLLRWVRFTGTVYFNQAGELDRFAGVAQDVTEQTLARQQLEQSEARYRALSEKLEQQVATRTQKLDVANKALALSNEEVRISVEQQALSQQQLDVSETQFRLLVEQAPVAMAVFRGPDYVIELVNQAHLAIWGRTREQVLGKPLFEAIPEARGQGYEALLDQVMATGDPYVAHEWSAPLLRQGQLETVYFNFVYQPFSSPDGTITGVTVVAFEITEQVKARQDVLRFKYMADNARDAFILMRQDGSFAYLNELALVRWGYTPQEARSIRVPDVDPIYTDTVFGAAFAQAQREDIPPFDTIHQRKDGTIYPVEVSMGGLLLDGQPHMLAIARDITDRKRAEQTLLASEARYRELAQELDRQVQERTEELAATNEELAATNEELTASNEELLATNEDFVTANHALEVMNTDLVRSNQNLEQFAYIASHDLQEPLRKIQQFGDLLQSQYGERLGDGNRYLTRMQLAASRMSVLIKDLLTFSRIATSQAVANPVALSPLVDQVLDTLSVVIEESQAQIRVAPLPIVAGDESQLRQLFQNLLSNALKFSQQTPTGELVAPQVTIQARRVARSELAVSLPVARQAAFYELIEIADNGIGFEEKYLDRIFQVFQRLHGRNEFSGSGVGLAIVQKVVTNHGGVVTASSKPGAGATFSVYLPV